MTTNSSVDKRSITSLPSIESHLNELLNARELGHVNLYPTYISNPESLKKLERALEIKNSQSQELSQPFEGRQVETLTPALKRAFEIKNSQSQELFQPTEGHQAGRLTPALKRAFEIKNSQSQELFQPTEGHQAGTLTPASPPQESSPSDGTELMMRRSKTRST